MPLAHYSNWNIFDGAGINVVILEPIHARRPHMAKALCLLDTAQMKARPSRSFMRPHKHKTGFLFLILFAHKFIFSLNKINASPKKNEFILGNYFHSFSKDVKTFDIHMQCQVCHNFFIPIHHNQSVSKTALFRIFGCLWRVNFFCLNNKRPRYCVRSRSNISFSAWSKKIIGTFFRRLYQRCNNGAKNLNVQGIVRATYIYICPLPKTLGFSFSFLMMILVCSNCCLPCNLLTWNFLALHCFLH